MRFQARWDAVLSDESQLGGGSFRRETTWRVVFKFRQALLLTFTGHFDIYWMLEKIS
jgi:hypothetical protein